MASEQKLTQANLDRTVWIKACDTGDYHVEITRRIQPPGQTEPTFQKFVQCFKPADWDRYMKMDGSKGLDFKAACLIYRYRVVHDPRKVSLNK